MAHPLPSFRATPFHFESHDESTPAGWLAKICSPLIERFLAFPALNRLYRQAVSGGPDQPFYAGAMGVLGVAADVTAEEVLHVPAKGPLVVVANHPFGGLDGLVLAAMLQRVRPDVKVLANRLLRVIPELRDSMLFVDPFGGPDAAARNVAAMRGALKWVREGGALVVFPAGEVSSLNRRTGEVADIPWSPVAARLIRATWATVLPVFFHGQNSWLFQAAGLIHPRLRTALLPRELLRQRGRRIAVTIGRPIPPQKLAAIESDDELATYLRVRTYVMASRARPASQRVKRQKAQRVEQPIAPPEPSGLLAAVIARLPTEDRLASSGPLEVWIGESGQLGPVLTEIGRLREVTFRGVGEGSGKPIDLDRFDDAYLHLFVWNTAKREVVGAYRLGLTDRILAARGKAGLYTSALFDFRDDLLAQISPAIELGRSFVRPEYQKEFAPLMLLWKGIALFVARHPGYRRLFGPVSISNEYQSLSREILMAFLRRNALAADLAKGVAPRNPPKLRGRRDGTSKLAALVVKTVEAVDELVGEIESDRAGMPVLLRQYLKLNAKLLGFNVDADFGDVLDGLMLVDLLDVAPAILTRYMGRDALTAYYAHHGRTV
jgi:putative hemolysin